MNVKMMVQGEERMNELVSIIVPVHNGEAYLQDCVQSVLEQTYPNFEMIIIDDGSEDTTWSLCERIKKTDNRIRIFHQEKKGVSEARNFGLDRSAGKYIVFLDGDDMLHPSFLEKTMKRAKQTEADIVGCSFFKVPTEKVLHDVRSNFKENFDVQWISINPEETLEWFYCNKIPALNMVTCKLIDRRVLFKENGEFLKFEREIAFGEDTLYMHGLAQKGFRMEYTPVEWYLYRTHEKSATHRLRREHEDKALPYYKRMREEAIKDGYGKQAKEIGTVYLGLLRKRYNLAKKKGQKEICKAVRTETYQVLETGCYKGLKIIYLLTFHSWALYKTGSSFCHIIKKIWGEMKCSDI